MQRLVDEGRAPKVIALENVVGAITSHGGKDFENIVSRIVEWRISRRGACDRRHSVRPPIPAASFHCRGQERCARGRQAVEEMAQQDLAHEFGHESLRRAARTRSGGVDLVGFAAANCTDYEVLRTHRRGSRLASSGTPKSRPGSYWR